MFKKFSLFFGIFLSIFSFVISFSNSNISNNTPIYPTKSNCQISSTFGYRTIFGRKNFHDGIDFAISTGTPIYASLAGIVSYCDFTKTGYGNAVILTHTDGLKTLYGHIDETFIVHLGQSISKGELIGYVGPKFLSNGKLNGNTTGPHLHFSIYKAGKAIDPLLIIKKTEPIS